MITPKNILVPVDFSEFSEEALAHAVAMARSFGARLHILHVVEAKLVQCIDDYCLNNALIKEMGSDASAQYTGEFTLTEGKVRGIEEEAFRAAERMLKEMAGKLDIPSEVEVTISITRGLPYEEIVREQKEKGIDLIVMPAHGKGGLKQYYLGSTTEKVVRHATCSVTAVRR